MKTMIRGQFQSTLVPAWFNNDARSKVAKCRISSWAKRFGEGVPRYTAAGKKQLHKQILRKNFQNPGKAY